MAEIPFTKENIEYWKGLSPLESVRRFIEFTEVIADDTIESGALPIGDDEKTKSVKRDPQAEPAPTEEELAAELVEAGMAIAAAREALSVNGGDKLCQRAA